MNTVKNYLSLIKFSHTIFAMPFAMIGFFIAIMRNDYATSVVPGWHTRVYQWNLNKTIGWSDNTAPFSEDSLLGKIFTTDQDRTWLAVQYFLLVILCMVFARNAAMAFNRYLDREFDAKNARTAVREIPSGIITPGNALGFTIVNCLLFSAATFFINRLCFFLSPVALLVILGYSYTKRFTALCHVILGIGLSLAPIGAYLAVTGKFALLPLIFSGIVLTWVSGFDIIYALQDVEFDRSEKLHSVPAAIGKSRALHVSEGFHLASAILVLFAGLFGNFGWLYWIGAAVFILMLIYQHRLVKPNDLRKVNLAFMTTNGIASVVFAALVIADLFFNPITSY